MHKDKLLKVYSCSFCGEVEVKNTTPKIRGCKKSSFHNWVCLGEHGLDKYVCKNCGIKVKMYAPPSTEGCTSAVKVHEWNKV